MNRRIRVGVIFGGRSGEHEISLLSAASVIAGLDRKKYQVVPIGITHEGRWLAPAKAAELLPSDVFKVASVPVTLPADPSARDLVALDGTAELPEGVENLDVFFPVLHGTYGEDGTLQGLLELANVPYVGAGVLGSAVGMDKDVQKRLFRDAGLPVVRFESVLRSDLERDPETVAGEIERRIGYPCFAKPANLGSSVGISKVHDREELLPALRDAARYDRKILVEEGVDAREIECSVLGNDDPVASVPGEVIPSREFYDYEAKYVDEGSRLVIPADLALDLREEIRSLAVRAFETLDLCGMARVDFLLDRTSLAPHVSEANTIPGFTAISMYPKLWQESGLRFPDLLDRLIELAFERHRDKNRSLTRYAKAAHPAA